MALNTEQDSMKGTLQTRVKILLSLTWMCSKASWAWIYDAEEKMARQTCGPVDVYISAASTSLVDHQHNLSSPKSQR